MGTMPGKETLEGLNPTQKEAVMTQNGPILIVAGAGSGKTKVLTHRIAHLVALGVGPDKILAVTFTNKAAGEMKERVAKLLSTSDPRLPAPGPWIGTFHSLGAWILRRENEKASLSKNFVILDEEDGLAVMKEAVKELELDPKQFQPARLKKIISRKKGSLETADEYAREAEDPFSKALAGAWQLYEQKLRAAEALDFDDLLVKTYFLFADSPETLAKYQEHWQYVNIDEYQDTDQVQYRLANMLAQKHKNICVVGDIDQSIYSFRGADFRNILNFENDWPEAKIITLEENYRSHEPILDAANSVISKNLFRKPKNLFTQKTGGDKIGLFAAENEEEEAEFIAEKTGELIKNRVQPDEIAVLMRTNAQSRVIEEKFLSRGIPYLVVGVKFYLRKEIKDVLAYMKAALNPKDRLSLKRIINTPPRGIGKVAAAKY
ncbi:MAG: UvrD-helicase domain-containing protein [Candidatus Niyogibacteria bacterium]|nr:UvrD-helicase domain-containing protein [Candidatus Niyogibacteria bacterium]